MKFTHITLNILSAVTLSIFLGCSSSTSITSQWPLQPGYQDVYRYYEGQPLPKKDIAILEVHNPLGIFVDKNKYYYSGKFALKPGNQTIPISYFLNVGRTSYSSDEPSGIELYAEKGHTYRTFCLAEDKLYQETRNTEDLYKFLAEIYDITDKQAITSIIQNSPWEAFRQEAKELLLLGKQ